MSKPIVIHWGGSPGRLLCGKPLALGEAWGAYPPNDFNYSYKVFLTGNYVHCPQCLPHIEHLIILYALDPHL